MEERNFALIAIVAIVAIVGMVVLITGGRVPARTSPSTITLPSGEQGNVAGQAYGYHHIREAGEIGVGGVIGTCACRDSCNSDEIEVSGGADPDVNNCHNQVWCCKKM